MAKSDETYLRQTKLLIVSTIIAAACVWREGTSTMIHAGLAKNAARVARELAAEAAKD